MKMGLAFSRMSPEPLIDRKLGRGFIKLLKMRQVVAVQMRHAADSRSERVEDAAVRSHPRRSVLILDTSYYSL